MEEKRTMKLMESVAIMFIDDVISHQERNELLMRLQCKLDSFKEANRK